MYLQHAHTAPRGLAQDGINGPAPVIFWGTTAPDGDATPWDEAALGSIYVRSAAGNVVAYLKEASTSADGDWHAVTTS